MDDWDFDLFRDYLKLAVKMFHNDKCSKIETFVSCKNKEYKIIIEEVKNDTKGKERTD